MTDPGAPSVLIVEDEVAQMEMLAYNIAAEGYRVLKAETGEEGLLIAEEEEPDLILLDWMLPDISGVELCRRLRRTSAAAAMPIVMLTARGQEEDRVRGLDAGADDYVVKPYSVKELTARIRAILRRAREQRDGDALRHGDLVMDLGRHRVTRGGAALHLGPTEYRMLAVLMEKPGRVFSRERLLDLVWGRDVYVEARTVDVHVGRLRKALKAEGAPDPIRTVRGAGYALDFDG